MNRNATRVISRSLVNIIVIIFGAAWAQAQGGLPASIPAPPGSVRFGSSISSGGDADNDGCEDIFIVDARYRDANETTVGKWYMYSGRTGKLMWSQQGVVPNDGSRVDGACSDFVGDIDGDECDDIILGVPGLLNGRGGFAVLSGFTGKILYSEVGEFEDAELGRDVAAAGDYNGDLIPDVVYAVNRKTPGGGGVQVRSGTSLESRLASSVTSGIPIRRVTSIGVRDSRHDDGTSIVYGQWDGFGYGQPATVFWNLQKEEVGIPVPDPLLEFGYQMTGGADVTGDGVPDFAISTSGSLDLEDVFVYSGAALGLITHIPRPLRGYTFGVTLDFANPNGDDEYEIVIGEWSSMNVHDPLSGALLHRVPASPNGKSGQVYGEEFAIGDINGDGFDDYIAGAFKDDVTGDVEVRAYGGAGVFLHLLDDQGEMSVEESITPGSTVRFEITGALPFRNMHLLTSRSGNGCTYVEPLHTCVDLDRPIRRAGVAMTDANGVARFELEVSPDAEPGTVWMQVGDPKHYWLGPVKSNVVRLEIMG